MQYGDEQAEVEFSEEELAIVEEFLLHARRIDACPIVQMEMPFAFSIASIGAGSPGRCNRMYTPCTAVALIHPSFSRFARWILIDKEADSIAEIARRIGLLEASKAERKATVAAVGRKAEDNGPLFAEAPA